MKEGKGGYYYRGEDVTVEKVKELYERRYKRNLKRGNQKQILNLLRATLIPEIISKTKNPTALDVGCGYGHYVEGLRQLGCKAYGIDLSKRVVNKAKKLHPKCTFLVGDGLKPRKQKFNIVMCRAASFYNGPIFLKNGSIHPHKILATDRLLHLVKSGGLLAVIHPTQSKKGKSGWDSPQKRWFWTTEKEFGTLLSLFGDVKISSQKRPKGRHLIGQLRPPKEWPSRSQYRRFLDVLTDSFEVMPVKDYEKSSKRKKCLLRHDIDQGGNLGITGLPGAMMMAEEEGRIGIHSTYYVLHTAKYYSNRKLVIKNCKRLQNMGHEVGFHNNIITACLENKKLNPKQLLERELDFFKKNGIKIHGTAAHGTTLCRKLEYANYQIFKECPAWNKKYQIRSKIENVELKTLSLEDYGLYEAYFIPEMDYYLSDSGGVWNFLKVSPSKPFFEYEDVQEIDDFAGYIKKLSKEKDVNLIEVLTHPGTWFRKRFELFRQRYKYEI